MPNVPTQSPHSCQSEMTRTHLKLASVEKRANVWGSEPQSHVYIYLFSTLICGEMQSLNLSWGENGLLDGILD